MMKHLLLAGMLLAPTAAYAACPVGMPVLRGTMGDDVLVGTERAECIEGLGGDDILIGLGGDDVLLGGPGRDKLEGGHGNDVLRGGPGLDTLTGGDGVDRFEGQMGGDVIVADVRRGGDSGRGIRGGSPTTVAAQSTVADRFRRGNPPTFRRDRLVAALAGSVIPIG